MPGNDVEKSVPRSSAVEKQEADNEEVSPAPRKLYPIVRKQAHGFFKFIFSHRMIPILKGTLIATNPLKLMHLD